MQLQFILLTTWTEVKMADFNPNDTMVEMFLFETSQLLEQLEQIILSNDREQCYSEETINEIFRIMHTIKGSSAMMMYNEISELTHKIEDLFYYVREEKPIHYSCSSLNDLILDSVDFIKLELEKIRKGHNPDGNPAKLLSRLNDLLLELKKNGESSPMTNIFKAIVIL